MAKMATPGTDAVPLSDTGFGLRKQSISAKYHLFGVYLQALTVAT